MGNSCEFCRYWDRMPKFDDPEMVVKGDKGACQYEVKLPTSAINQDPIVKRVTEYDEGTHCPVYEEK